MNDTTTDSPRWWAKKRLVHEDVWTVARRIENDQSGRREQHARCRALYEDSYRGRTDKQVVSYNLVRSIIDTVCAKVSKSEPRVQVLTVAGDFALQERSEKLTRFLGGQFREMGLRQKAQLCFRDACIFDGGVLRVYRDQDSEKIKCERVYPHEILVDTVESYYGQPRQVFLKRPMNRDVLAAMYPKKAAWIKDLPPSRLDQMRGANDLASMVDVIESWHLPSREGASDGRHVICVETATLYDAPWTRADFPFVFFRWQEPVNGFWFEGLTRELAGLQAELNTHYENIRVSHKRGGRWGAWLPDGSTLNEEDLNDEIGFIIKGGDRPPQMIETPTLHPQHYNWAQQLKSDGHEMTGASQTASRGQKPDGVISGAAIREVNDIESERFILASQRYEDLFIEIAEKVIRLAREMYEDGVDMTIKARDRAFLESIKWSDVDMDDDTYDLAMFKTSGLPQRPEGKIEKTIELMEAGIISKDTAGELLGGMPDIDAALATEQAPRKNINRMLDLMVREKKQLQPLPYMNLELAKTLTVNKLNWCDVESVGDDAKERLITFLKLTEDLLGASMPTEPAPPPMPMGAPPMGPPPGDPMMDPAMGMDPMAGAPPMPGDMPPEMMLPPDGLPPMAA